MKDPKFLRSILPISLELDAILRRIFEFNPSQRITIPELREMILQCSTFTVTKSAVPTPLPSPPVNPVDYSQEAAFRGCYQPPQVPFLTPLSGPGYSPPAYQVPYPRFSTSSGSSNSENDSVFSSCSSGSSTSSSSSYQNVSPQNIKFAARVPQSTYVSPPPPANTWYQPFIQAANLVKHVSFQPSIMTGPVRVY